MRALPTRCAKSRRRTKKDLVAAHDLVFAPPAVNALVEATRLALNKTRALLVARERDGLVRRCHGDLHLGNIVLLDGAPVLFDAIEFDPTFATIDVLYDLAFLLMDLIERGLRLPANIVFNRYLTQTRRDGDLDALAALPLFLSLRAAIRAKVTAARQDKDKDPAGAQSARDYFALAGKLPGAAAADADRGRRPVGHRQVAAGARAGRRHPPRARRGVAAQRRRAQGAVRRRPKPTGCRKPPMRATSPRRSMPRSPPRRAACWPPGIRRSSMRCLPTPRSAPRSNRPPEARLRSMACS